MVKDLLVTNIKEKQNADSMVWLRIGAFLELKSLNTQQTYLGIIKEWSEFLGAPAGSLTSAELFLKATDLHAIAYKKWLESRPGQKPRANYSKSSETQISTIKNNQATRDGLQASQTNATIAKKFAALRRVYRMLIASDLGITKNPFDVDRVPPPSKLSGQKRPTEMISFEKVQEIVNLPDEKTPKGLRDKAILALLFGGGLRRSEATKIRITDIKKTANHTTYVYLRSTKGRKDASQALPNWSAKIVHALVDQRLKAGASSGDYLLVSYRGPGGLHSTNNPLSNSGLYRLFLRYCKLAGVNNFVSPHSARATAITKLLSSGFTHREVQEFSRHASIAMVEVYDKRRISVDESPAKDLDYDK
jgi:site-specific recombinase XerD